MEIALPSKHTAQDKPRSPVFERVHPISWKARCVKRNKKGDKMPVDMKNRTKV
jgi:hypothetical protein